LIYSPISFFYQTGTPPPSLDTTPLTPQTLPSFLLSNFPALTPSLNNEEEGHHVLPSSSFWLEVEGVVLVAGEGEEGEEGGAGGKRVSLLPSTQVGRGGREGGRKEGGGNGRRGG